MDRSWHLVAFSSELPAQLELDGFMKEFWMYYQKHPDRKTATIWKKGNPAQQTLIYLSPQASGIAKDLIRFYAGRSVPAPDLSGLTDLCGNAA